MGHTWVVIALVWAALTGHGRCVTVITTFNSTSAIIGTNVLFSINFSGNTKDPTVTWVHVNQIAIWPAINPSAAVIRSDYQTRVNVFANGSLLLNNVLLTDSGTYSVTVADYSSPDGIASLQLSVYESISNVTLQAIPSATAKLGSSPVLQCTAGNITSANNLSFVFFKDQAELTTIAVTAGTSASYTINNVTYSQRGNYSCRAQNPISSQQSAAVMLELECNPSATPTLTVPSNSIISTVGQGSTLAVGYAFAGKTTVSWKFGGQLVAEWVLPGDWGSPQEFSEGGGYTGRTAAFQNGSLLVKVAQATDKGSYTFLATTCNSLNSMATIALTEDPWPSTRSAIIGGVVGGVGGLLLLILLILLILFCCRKRREKKAPPKATKKAANVETVRRVEPPQQQPWSTTSTVDARNRTVDTQRNAYQHNGRTDTMGQSNLAYNSYTTDMAGGARGANDWRTDGSSVGAPSVGESSLPVGADFSYTNGNARPSRAQNPLDYVGFPDSLTEQSEVKTNPKYRAMTAV